jgi:hypothetical protein
MEFEIKKNYVENIKFQELLIPKNTFMESVMKIFSKSIEEIKNEINHIFKEVSKFFILNKIFNLINIQKQYITELFSIKNNIKKDTIQNKYLSKIIIKYKKDIILLIKTIIDNCEQKKVKKSSVKKKSKKNMNLNLKCHTLESSQYYKRKIISKNKEPKLDEMKKTIDLDINNYTPLKINNKSNNKISKKNAFNNKKISQSCEKNLSNCLSKESLNSRNNSRNNNNNNDCFVKLKISNSPINKSLSEISFDIGYSSPVYHKRILRNKSISQQPSKGENILNDIKKKINKYNDDTSSTSNTSKKNLLNRGRNKSTPLIHKTILIKKKNEVIKKIKNIKSKLNDLKNNKLIDLSKYINKKS